MQRSRRRRWLWLVAAVAAIAGAGFSLRQFRPAPEPVAAQQTTRVIRGDLSAATTATGHVAAAQSADITAGTPGYVRAVPVAVGDPVAAGDVLVQLDDAELTLNVANAEQALRLQEANLAQLLAPAADVDIQSAEAQLAAAEAQLADLLAGPTDLEIALATANVDSAAANRNSAAGNLQSVRDGVTPAQLAAAEAQLAQARAVATQAQLANEDDPTIDTHTAWQDALAAVNEAQAALDALLDGPARGSLGTAQSNVNAADARVDAAAADLANLLAGPTAAQIAAAEAQVAQAEATLDRLHSGPSAADVRAAEAQVAQAQLNLASATDALADATVTAPFDGTVTRVWVAPGEQAAGPVVSLVAAAGVEVVLDVDEIDIAALADGQPATVTLEPWPDAPVDATIAAIAPTATAGGGALVTYAVRLTLDTDLPLRVGMTATAQMETASRSDVLLLESRAVRSERQTGVAEVDRLVDDIVETVPVTLGLRDSTYTEIVAGLAEGDIILIDYIPPAAEDGGPSLLPPEPPAGFNR